MLKRPQNIISGFAATEKIQSMAKVRKVFWTDTGGTAFPSLSNLLPPLILLKQGSQNFFFIGIWDCLNCPPSLLWLYWHYMFSTYKHVFYFPFPHVFYPFYISQSMLVNMSCFMCFINTLELRTWKNPFQLLDLLKAVLSELKMSSAALRTWKSNTLQQIAL